MADDEPIQNAICSPTSAIPYAGSCVRWCQFCAAEVWVSPGTTKLVDAGKARATCEQCAGGVMKQNPDERIMMPDHVRADLRGLGFSDQDINQTAKKFAREMRQGTWPRQ